MDDNSLNDLARRLVELRQDKRYLEGEIERVAHELVEALGQGTNVSVRAPSRPRPGASRCAVRFCSHDPAADLKRV
ncbi:MAG: hypothetical protein SGI72_06930, partial [Planctomycetota bacterium]|nr:hypothetical protein [Planctomycetota bacterium]